LNCWITRGRKVMPIEGTAAIRMRPVPRSRILAAVLARLFKPTKARSTSLKNALPSLVGTRCAPVRSNSLSEVSPSSCAIRRLILGCEVCRSRAAAVIDPDNITALKASI
jgi:hypothetical protein